MSGLSQFRRRGGLMQLLQLIETSESHKQTRLLKLIGKEDPGWAHLMKTKRLSIPRIFSWPDEILTQILFQYPPNFAAHLATGLDPELLQKLERCLPKLHRTEYSLLREDPAPNAREHWSAQAKLIQLVREMTNRGRIILKAVDPEMEIDDLLVP
jgi:flagellar motor switch protein FliG